MVPLAGVLLVAAGLAWAIRQRYFDEHALGLALVGLLMFLSPFVFSEIPHLAHYVQAVLYSGFVFGACVLVYLFGREYNVRLDLTPQRLHSLSEPTAAYLRLLDQDVKAWVFDTDRRPYEALLDRYREATPRFSWSLHDPRREPDLARRFDPEIEIGTVYVEQGSRRRRLGRDDLAEAALTQALVEVTRQRPVKVYFLTGHGELSIAPSTDPNAASASRSARGFAHALGRRGIETGELDLAAEGGAPRDADAILLAGPVRDLFEVEARLLEAYLERGGRLMILLDVPPTGQGAEAGEVAALLRRHGLADDESVILDLAGQQLMNNLLQVPLAAYNSNHPITSGLARTAGNVVLGNLRCLAREDPAPIGVEAVPLVESSPQAWCESLSRVYGPLGGRATPPGADRLNRRAIGWAVQGPAAEGRRWRLAAFGTSQLLWDRVLEINQTAADLMIGTVAWLTEQEDTILVPTKTLRGTPLVITDAELRLILIVLGLALPAAIFLGGVSYTRFLRRG